MLYCILYVFSYVKISFYELDLYEKNFTLAQSVISNMTLNCQVYHHDYNGKKYTCLLDDMMKFPLDLLSEVKVEKLKKNG